ncbi:hypothetical protein [Aureimonas sp. N4]|uniref:hypothetical protein n=1 Tax=Aureimonas sp. N4 TaxID=1638165 RepID=UPI000783651C|nr:hypothetical protein [Aureimonas sp. N4]
MSTAPTEAQQCEAVLELVKGFQDMMAGISPVVCSAAIVILAATDIERWADDPERLAPTSALFAETMIFIAERMFEARGYGPDEIAALTLAHRSRVLPGHPEPTIRQHLAAFAGRMEKRLRENDHKGGWSNEKPEWLADRCLAKACDASKALDQLRGDGLRNLAVNREAIQRHTADLANYAMMLCDVTTDGGLVPEPEGEAA